MKSERGFESHAANTLLMLRSSIIAVLSALPGGKHTGTTLSRDLKLDKTLTWKLMNFVENDDIFVASKYIPGEPSFRKFIERAKEKGISASESESAIMAYREYQKLMDKYAGNRAALDLMLLALSREGSLEAFQNQKKNKFLAERFINGISASVNFVVGIYPEVESTAIFKCFEVAGITNLIRYRKASIHSLKTRYLEVEHNDSQRNMIKLICKPLSDKLPKDALVAYLPEYCTCSMIQPETSESLLLLDNLIPDSSKDLDESVDCVTAIEVYFRNEYDADDLPDHVNYDHTMKSSFPCELLIFDLFLHSGMSFSAPQVRVYNEIELGKANSCKVGQDDIYRMPFDENIMYMGRGALCSQIQEIPRYSEMLEDVFSRVGEDSRNYDLYRVKIQYPYFPSFLTLHFDYRTKQDSV